MRKWHVYWPLHPLVSPLRDDGSRMLFSHLYQEDSIAIDVGVIGQESSLEAIRCVIDSEDGLLAPAQLKAIHNSREIMLSTLRMMHDYELRLRRIGREFISFGCFVEENSLPKFHVELTLQGANALLNLDVCRTTFEANASNQTIARLLADAIQLSLPEQYRYLSLYKILEIEFRRSRKWFGLNEALAPFEAEFQGLDVSRRPLSFFIHEFRDRCAHIKLGHRDHEGVTGLDMADTDKMAKFMPFFIRIVAVIVGLKGGYKLVVQ